MQANIIINGEGTYSFSGTLLKYEAFTHHGANLLQSYLITLQHYYKVASNCLITSSIFLKTWVFYAYKTSKLTKM